MLKTNQRTGFECLAMGCLILFILVFAMELALLIPCGGWAGLAECDIPDFAEAMWQDYFRLDPLWGEMPTWYIATMTLQDYVFNPWWCIALVVFLKQRQTSHWFISANIFVSAMLFTTTIIYFFCQYHYPETTSQMFKGLLLVNGYWILMPAIMALNSHRSLHQGSGVGVHQTSSGGKIALLLLPTLSYTLLCAVSIAFFIPK